MKKSGFSVLLNNEITASGRVLGSYYSAVLQGKRFTSFIAVGASDAQTVEGQCGLTDFLAIKQCDVIGANFDPSLGKCFVTCEAVFSQFELAGRTIREVGLSFEGNEGVVSRAIVPPQSKEGGKLLVVSATLFVDIDSDECALVLGENPLVKALLGQDGIGLGNRVEIGKGNVDVDGNRAIRCLSAQDLRACEILLDDSGLSFRANMQADGEILLCIDKVPSLRCYPITRASAVAENARYVCGEFEPFHRRALEITSIKRGVLNMSMEYSRQVRFPKSIIDYNAEFIKLNPDMQTIYSPRGDYCALIGKNDITVLRFDTNKISAHITAAIPIGQKKYQVCDNGEIVILSEDCRGFRIFTPQNCIYKERVAEYQAHTSIDDFSASTDFYGRLTIAAAFFAEESAVNMEFEQQNERFVVTNFKKVQNLYFLRGLHSFGGGYSLIEYSGLLLFNQHSLSLFSGAQIGFNANDKVRARGFFIELTNADGAKRLFNFNLVDIKQIEGDWDFAPNILMDCNQNRLRILPSRIGESYEIQVEGQCGEFENVVLNKQHILFVQKDGKCREWLLDDVALYFWCNPELGDLEYRVGYDYKEDAFCASVNIMLSGG